MPTDNSLQGGADTIRDKDRGTAKTQIVGRDLNIGGGAEVLEVANPLQDALANPTVPGYAAFLAQLNQFGNWDRVGQSNPLAVDLGLTVRSLLQAIANPIWGDPATGRLRVLLDPLGTLGTITTVGTVSTVTTVGTVTTVTTVGTVTTVATVTTVTTVAAITSLNGIGGVKADGYIYDVMTDAYANSVRRNIT